MAKLLSDYDQTWLSDLKRAEGCPLDNGMPVAYKDSMGIWTIGWGHNLEVDEPGRDFTGYKVFMEQALNWLQQDVDKAYQAASQLPEWQKSNNARQCALTELIFNMGLKTWFGFINTRKAWQEERWPDATAGLLKSRWASQVGKTRSQRIAGYVLDGEV